MATTTQIKRLERLERQQTKLMELMDLQEKTRDFVGLKKTLALSCRIGLQMEKALVAISG